jgi:protein TonB
VAASAAEVASLSASIGRALVYPSLARRRGWEGVVRLSFTLFADGTLAGLAVVASSGHDLLDQAALAAVRAAAPFPAPGVDVRVTLPLQFRLQ